MAFTKSNAEKSCCAWAIELTAVWRSVSWSRIEYFNSSKAYVVGAAVESNVHENPS